MASLVGWLGAVALIFALLSFLILLGSPGWDVSDLYFTLGNLAVGVALLFFSLATNLDKVRERLRSGEARRAGKYGTSAILATLLGIALLSLLAFLSTRYHERWDWTEAKSHSISSQTQKVLDGLDGEVKVTALYAAVSAAPAREFLERYTLASPRVKVEFVDPQAQPGRLAELKIDPSRLEGGLLHVEIGHESVDVKDLTEEAFTNAIVKLTRHEKKKVYFLIGHNERAIEGDGAKENGGFDEAATALRNENYEVAPLLLAAKGDVPADANVVIAAGPTRPYHPDEHAALQRWIEKGGALLVMLDPSANTDLYSDLARWGVEVGDDVVVDRVSGLMGRPTTPFAAEYADHPITKELRDAAMFHTARSVQPKPEAAQALAPIVKTGDQSWAERDMERLTTTGEVEQDDRDLAGPVPVVVAGEVQLGPAPVAPAAATPPAAPRARLVVMGDSDFATNQLIHEFRNLDLFVNSVNWLLGDVEAISIRPNPPRASRLQLSQEQFMQIRYLALFVLPELIAVLGVWAWWSRRRAPGR